MFDWLFSTVGCLSNPVACVVDTFAAVPADWWFYAGFLLGTVIGATFGWLGLFAFLASLVIRVLPARKGHEEPLQYELPFNDRQPSNPRKPRPTIFDAFKRRHR